MVAYFESKLAGYIGYAVLAIGLIITIAPNFVPFLPPADAKIAGDVLAALGGVKTWLAANPFASVVTTPATTTTTTTH